MNPSQLKQYCAQFVGAKATLYAAPSNILVYSVCGKTFAYFKTSEPEKWRFSLWVASSHFLELTDRAGIKPARYRGRYGWITIVNVRSFPADYLRELLQASYLKALRALSQKQQNSLQANPPAC